MVNKKYPPWIGGIEKVVRDISYTLKDKIDIEVLVTSDTKKRIEDQYEGVKVIREPALFTLGNTPVSFKMISALKKTDADIIHFHHPYPWGDIAYLTAGPKAKTLVTYQSDIIKQKYLLKLYRPFMIRFLSKMDRIVAASPQMIEYSSVLKKFQSKCEVIPNGIDISIFDDQNIDPVNVSKIKDKYGPRIILFIGRLIYYKGIEYLIEAMQTVDANLVIIGSGPLKNQMSELCRKLGLSKRVFFLENISDEELPQFYHASEMFVLPSIERTEAFGLVQVEAMASGKPVVCTNLKSGVPFVNKDGETGFVVPPKSSNALAEAINKLLGDNELREKFGAAGRKRATENFTINKMADSYLDLYNKLLE